MKRNIKLYNLSDYPYNFTTESDRNGSVEKGWTGKVLLLMLKDLLQYKNPSLDPLLHNPDMLESDTQK